MPSVADPLQPESPAPVVRVWSPLAVAVYGLFLFFPASLALAVKNWRALGVRGRILPHVAGAFVLALLTIGTFLFAPPLLRRLFRLATMVLTFVYLKERLRSDLQDFKDRHPEVRVETRRWQSGCGWAMLGLMIFMAMVSTAGLIVAVLKSIAGR